MKKLLFLLLPLSVFAAKPDRTQVLANMHLAKSYFQGIWPDVTKVIVSPDKTRPSNIWTRSVFYEGLIELYKLDPKAPDLKYMEDWGEFHHWSLRNGLKTRNADDQACGQVYLDLFDLKADSARIKPIKENIDNMVATEKSNDWSWVDCLQMSMPVYTRLGLRFKDDRYFKKMHDLYTDTKVKLYNQQEHLWWRDKDFIPPYKEPNGTNCYWSRGNGWVFAALARTLDLLPANAPYRAEYVKDFQDMAAALLPLQRKDGFFNVSLTDESNYGGPELTGSALFVYGLSWGIRQGLLPASKYQKSVDKGWKAIDSCVQPTGFLSYVQGTGKEPKDSQPVTKTSVPNFEDFGVGCYLLAGSEILRAK